jgi:hypothetical protein
LNGNPHDFLKSLVFLVCRFKGFKRIIHWREKIEGLNKKNPPGSDGFRNREEKSQMLVRDLT